MMGFSKMLLGAAVGAVASVATAVVVKKLAKKTAKPIEADVVMEMERDNAPPRDTRETAERAERVSTDYYEAVRNAYDGGPNANPVYSPVVETPRTEDGKIDVTKLASPEDFCNWDELGCQS